MADKLTPKQEAFADGIAAGMTQSDAYREAYPGTKMTPKQIWEEASKLAAHPKVSQRLFLLHEAIKERTLVTIESITKELEEARELAAAEKQSSAMTAASMGKAKVNGLLIDKVDSKQAVNINITGDDRDI